MAVERHPLLGRNLKGFGKTKSLGLEFIMTSGSQKEFEVGPSESPG
jgi:hypothetical protein